MTTITNLERLEDVISDLTNKVNQLSQDMRDFKEESRRENDALRQKIADLSSQVEQLLHERQPQGEGLGWIAPTSFYRERSASQPEKYKFLRDDSFDDDKAWLRSIAKTSHKMGTLTEDFVEPILPVLFKEVLNCHKEVELSMQRSSKRLPGDRFQHYSLLAVCCNYLLVADDVSYLDAEYISMFREKVETAREFLPMYAADKQVIGALLTFEVDLSMVPQGEREGFIMLGIIDGEVALLNQEGFVPKAY